LTTQRVQTGMHKSVNGIALGLRNAVPAHRVAKKLLAGWRN